VLVHQIQELSLKTSALRQHPLPKHISLGKGVWQPAERLRGLRLHRTVAPSEERLQLPVALSLLQTILLDTVASATWILRLALVRRGFARLRGIGPPKENDRVPHVNELVAIEAKAKTMIFTTSAIL
jgi:hypothetical protein